ncbi:MAG: hypothetical protein Q8Q60_04060 [Candidatus Chromulinivorax sp.]|nr:hypothetical protein [Candidatus Chromulinivorax sp.]
MKLHTKIFSLVIVLSAIMFVFASQIRKATSVHVVAQPVHKCWCGPTEHWFHKTCVKNYNKQFPQAGLSEDNDTESLPINILQAIEMLANDMVFVMQDGTPIIPQLHANGNLLLPMFKNVDYVLCKKILHDVDVTTILTAQELYEQWVAMLQVMQSAQ